MTRSRVALLVPVTAMILAGCAATRPAPTPHDVLWDNLAALCGKAFRGTVAVAPPGDTTFAGRALVMHVRACGDSAIRIPFHVGANRSRTWVLARTEAGIRLKHDHRHEDGSEDAITQYGGDLRVPHAPGLFEFPADTFTARLLPAARTNVWTIAVEPGVRFVYALRREGTDRRFRVEFDLSQPVEAPPPPWGSAPD